MPGRNILKSTLPTGTLLSPREGELTNSCNCPKLRVLPWGIGNATSIRKLAPALLTPARAAAFDVTGRLVSLVRFDGVSTARAKLPCVRVVVDNSMGMVALLPATLQPAGVSKPIMAFESGVVTWACVTAAGANARKGASQARAMTLTFKPLIFVAS